MTDHFYLLSNASTNIYPNTLSKFTNHFGQNPLTLGNETKWQIGLESIYIHPRFTNIPMLPKVIPHIKIYSSSEISSMLKQLKADNLPTDNVYDLVPHSAISIPYKHYTPQILLNTINEILFSKNPSLRLKFLGFKLDNDRFTIKMTPKKENMTNDEMVKYLRFNYEPILQNHICFHVELATMLGMVKEKQDYIRYLPEKVRNDLKLKELRPKIIKVEISNVQPIIQNNSHARILSHHTLNMINTHLHYVQFDNPLYLTLSSSIINDFTVRLLDENDRQLQLNPSLPTILKMSLRPLDEGTGEFNIVIDSTKKNPSHPNNTGTDFCFNLSPTLQLDSDYVCSINSISYSTYFKTLPIPTNEQYIKVTRKLPDSQIIQVSFPFNPKKKPFFNIQDVLNVLNEDCKVLDTFPYANALQHPSLEARCAKFVLEEIGGISFVNVGGFPNTTYDLPYELISVLGEKTDDTSNINRWIFELDTQTEISDLSKKRFAHPPDIISLIPITLFIYADFIQPIMVGETQVNLLQIVPVRSDMIDGHKNKYITEAIKRPNWAQVRLRTLDKLSFKILRSDGKPIEFNNERDGVIITLTFKKLPRAAVNNNIMFL
jgi:hypothetical protein